MSNIKTKPTDLNVDSFILNIEPAKKRMDCIELKKIFDSVLSENNKVI